MEIKISIPSLLQPFNGCDEAYVSKVCKGACCRSTVEPAGTLITIHPTETQAIEAQGGRVIDGILQPVNRRCPFQDVNNLCTLHFTKAKPFGCIMSPFTLNAGNTLIVRNRYRFLKCYKDKHPANKQLPAHTAFFKSLVNLFGMEGALEIRLRANTEFKNFAVTLDDDKYLMLKENDIIKKRGH